MPYKNTQIKPPKTDPDFSAVVDRITHGRLTLPAPDRLRGTYMLVKGNARVEDWGDDVKIIFELFRHKDMTRHLPEVHQAHVFMDAETGHLSSIVVSYKTTDGRTLRYKYSSIKDLNGVCLSLHRVGQFYVRDSFFEISIAH